MLTSLEALPLSDFDPTSTSQTAVRQSGRARQVLLTPDGSVGTRHHPALFVGAALHEVAGVVVGEVELVVGDVLVCARVPATNEEAL